MQPQVIICKDRAEWLEARKDGLGASDAAALLGLSPWKTNVHLWEEKCGLAIPEDIGDKPYVRYGNDAEPLLRSFFALDHPEYRDVNKAQKLINYLSDEPDLAKALSLPAMKDDNTQILIGPENVAEELKDTSVVLASYDIGDGMKGVIGVVGPTRMDYGKVAAKLSYVADGLSKLFGQTELPPGKPE